MLGCWNALYAYSYYASMHSKNTMYVRAIVLLVCLFAYESSIYIYYMMHTVFVVVLRHPQLTLFVMSR